MRKDRKNRLRSAILASSTKTERLIQQCYCGSAVSEQVLPVSTDLTVMSPVGWNLDIPVTHRIIESINSYPKLERGVVIQKISGTFHYVGGIIRPGVTSIWMCKRSKFNRIQIQVHKNSRNRAQYIYKQRDRVRTNKGAVDDIVAPHDAAAKQPRGVAGTICAVHDAR